MNQQSQIRGPLPVVALLLSTLLFEAHAAGMPAFPAEVDACIQSAVCTTPTFFVNSQFMQAYRYSDNGIDKYLMAYNLFPPSGQNAAFAGPVWLGMQQVYDLSDQRHAVNLYLDQINPVNQWILDSDGLDVILTLTTDDLLAGSGFFNLGEFGDGGFFLFGDLGTLGDQGQGGNLYPFGENHSFLPCLAASCEVGATLNLVNMMVVESGGLALVGFDLTDETELLYEQFVGFAGIRDTQTYYVQPVPIPPAIALLLSALATLGIKRRA